ncbi:hypothetical protein CDD83_6514 [Cordyceps sp. RAO-2017]|nr:hypothetical protein CDD83_6514 [Cordyceps sp. RAO-2017]
MKAFTALVLLATAAMALPAQEDQGKLAKRDCWWTGVQYDSWAERGCSQYGRFEAGRQYAYENGQYGERYYCCNY